LKVPTVVTPVPLTNVKTQTLLELGERVSALQAALPVNRDGLPLAYIDPQALAEIGFLEGNLSKEQVEKTMVPISYADSYAVANNLPFWERLDSELLDYYELFKAYRNMKYVVGRRSILEVSNAVNVPSGKINALSQVYHWMLRVLCYDHYKEMELRAQKEQSIKEMENKHSNAAKKLFDFCMKAIQSEEMELLLNPKTILEWFQTAVKLERISKGLDPDRPITKDDTRNIGAIIQSIQYDNRKVNIDVRSMQEVLDVLVGVGAIDMVMTKGKEENGNNSSGDGDRAATRIAEGSHSKTN